MRSSITPVQVFYGSVASWRKRLNAAMSHKKMPGRSQVFLHPPGGLAKPGLAALI